MEIPPGLARLTGSEGLEIPVEGTCSIGRGSRNHIRIAAIQASRRHAVIHEQDLGQHWIIDLGSANGTELNGRRLDRPTRLADGDRVRVADQEFVFHAAAEIDDSALENSSTAATMPEIRTFPCWLLLADIADSTGLTQRLDAATFASTVGNFMLRTTEIVETHGGTVNKYLGDGLLATWRHSAEAPTSIAAALVHFRLEQARANPAFRIVLHFGDVTSGGAARKGEESLVGPEVHYVFRAEKIGGTLGLPVLLSIAAAEALGANLPCEAVPGEYELKGFPGFHRFRQPHAEALATVAAAGKTVCLK